CAVRRLEVRGPPLPIGADFHQAAWMADETGRRFAAAHPEWTGLRHPPLPIRGDELPNAGSVHFAPGRRAPGDPRARAGVRKTLIANAHGAPPHAAALEPACRRVSRRRGVAMFTPS